MKIFGLSITKATDQTLSPPVPYTGGWGWLNGWKPGVIMESFTGAWQRNVEVRQADVLTFSAVYACITLIASDLGKLGLRLVQLNESEGVWEETTSSAFSPVLRKPNHYQTRQKFIEYWSTSCLTQGNTYILKERDNRGAVVAMYVLDPNCTKTLISPSGEVFYQLAVNNLAGIVESDEGRVVVPASEIIHDTEVALYHPLCGVSPISACGLAAVQGLSIQQNSAKFFQNGSNPGGILTAPEAIDDATAARLKKHWEDNYTGNNVGKVAVLGDGLKYEPMMISATDAQLIEQLKWTSEMVCTCFHIPPYMIGVGPPPSYNNIEALNQQYYSQCLQARMERIEILLDEGLGLVNVKDKTLGTEFNIDDLLKMDTSTQYKTYGEGVARGILAPNEARRKLGYKKVKGGNTPYLQQQNYSLEALDKRDQKDDPFATKPAAAAPAKQPQQQIEPPAPQKLLPPPEMTGDEMYAALGSALEVTNV